MGGTAFGKQAPRMSKEVFLIQSQICVDEVSKYASMCALVTTFSDKETFGDIDILVTDDFDVESFKANQTLDKNIEYVKNSDDISMLIHGYQVDLIFVNSSKFSSSLFYMMNDPMGMLLGVIAKQVGMRYGHTGLSVKLSGCDKNYYPRDIHVTSDPMTIMKILGFTQMQIGFDSVYDIFKLITTSEYFSPSLFKLENLNNSNRERNKKRKTYRDFLEYISNFENRNVVKMTMDDSIEYANKFNPEVVNTFIRLKVKHESKLVYKSKFNGNVVSELTGVTGKDLGKLMEYMNTVHKMKFIPEVVVSCSDSYIPDVVKEIHRLWVIENEKS